MTRDELIETMARALCIADGEQPDHREPGDDAYCDNTGVHDGKNKRGPYFLFWRAYRNNATAALTAAEAAHGPFKIGDRVRKTKGSSWQGRVVGFYSTSLTPVGYAVESEREPGSVQIYPASALEPAQEDSTSER